MVPMMLPMPWGPWLRAMESEISMQCRRGRLKSRFGFWHLEVLVSLLGLQHGDTRLLKLLVCSLPVPRPKQPSNLQLMLENLTEAYSVLPCFICAVLPSANGIASSVFCKLIPHVCRRGRDASAQPRCVDCKKLVGAQHNVDRTIHVGGVLSTG